MNRQLRLVTPLRAPRQHLHAVEVDETMYGRLNGVAHIWTGTSGEPKTHAQVVARMYEVIVDMSHRVDGLAAELAETQARLTEAEARAAAYAGSSPDEIAVHAIYAANRTEARFDPLGTRVRITEGPLAGQVFRSPGIAAKAVIRAHNPQANTARDGWMFWTVTATGRPLASIRAPKPEGSTS